MKRYTAIKFLLIAATAAIAQDPPVAPDESAPPAEEEGAKTVPAIPMVPMKPMPQADHEPQPEPIPLGSEAPDFASRKMDGKTVRLSDFKDKVVVLDFWATWCGPCLASLPHTESVAKQYKEQGVVVLACCTSDTWENFEQWAEANESKYPSIHLTCDPHERGSENFDQRASSKFYGISGLPTQFVIGRDGKIVATLIGFGKNDVRLEAALAKAGIKVDPEIRAEREAQMQD